MTGTLVVEGQAGAGKSPLIAAMAREIEARGRRCHVCAPFAEANAVAAAAGRRIGIYEDWGDSEATARAAERLLGDLIDGARARARSAGALLLLDRGWLTVCRGVEDSRLPEAERGEILSRWISASDPTFFLDTRPEITQSRASWRSDLPWTGEGIGRDFERRRILAATAPRLLARFDVGAPRVDLDSLAASWAEIGLRLASQGASHAH